MQDEITEAVTIAIAPAIADAEQQRAMRKPPGSLDAWAAYQDRAEGGSTTRIPAIRAGLLRAVAPAGTSRVTTLPAPITALSPMVTPGKMIAPPPIHTS